MAALTLGIVGDNTITSFAQDVHVTLRKINAGCTDLNVGKWCRFCKARATCPAQLEEAEQLLRVDPEDPDIEANELGFLVARASDMEVWIKSIMCRAHSELEAGKPVAGFKLVAKRGTRTWLDEDKARDRMRKKRLKVSDITETKLISPAKAEKLIKSRGSKCDLGDLIVSRSSGTTMAANDDKRPAIKPRDGSSLNLPETKLV